MKLVIGFMPFNELCMAMYCFIFSQVSLRPVASLTKNKAELVLDNSFPAGLETPEELFQ